MATSQNTTLRYTIAYDPAQGWRAVLLKRGRAPWFSVWHGACADRAVQAMEGYCAEEQIPLPIRLYGDVISEEE